MKKFDINELTAKATTYDTFGCQLITSNNTSDYVYNNAQQLVEFSYAGKPVFSVLWQNGISFLHGDYSLPDPVYDVYTDGDGIERKIESHQYLDEDEMAELCHSLSELTGTKITSDDVGAIREVIYEKRPDSPSSNIDDYVYNVNIIEWHGDNSEENYQPFEPVVVDTKTGVSYDEYCELCREHGFRNVAVTNCSPA